MIVPAGRARQCRPPKGVGAARPPDGEAVVEIRTEGTDGHVVIDAVQFLPR